MTIQNPHDTLFRDIFSDTERAAELIKTMLPKEIMAILNWPSLTQQEDSFVDEEMKQVHADLLYSIQTNDARPLKIYLLFEHKSYPDRNIHVQLLSYLSRIYGKMEKLVPILPLVFYHGKTEWDLPESFSDLFDLTPEQRELFHHYLPDFTYSLLDMTQTDMETMINSLTLKAILYTFKNIWHIDKQDQLDDLINISRDLFYEDSGLAIIQKILLYIYAVKEIRPQDVEESIARLISEDKGGIAMTTAELLDKQGFERGIEQGIVQGIKQGIEQGIEKAKREDAKKMLAEGLDASTISRITGLPENEIKKLK